jgi:hypothetical protein
MLQRTAENLDRTLYSAGKSASAALAVVAADPPVTSSILRQSSGHLQNVQPSAEVLHRSGEGRATDH